MQNVKSYLQTLWKSSSGSASRSRVLALPPSLIRFTDATLADLQQSQIDEKLLNEISRKLVESVVPPKLQICRHENQWFALNNSHLLIYRQLERTGLCDTVGEWRRTFVFSSSPCIQFVIWFGTKIFHSVFVKAFFCRRQP